MAARANHKSRDPSLLSHSHYDEDALPVHGDEGAESEEDDTFKHARTSAEIREHDQSILYEEEEREEVLGQSDRPNNSRLPNPLKNIFGKPYSTVPDNNGPRNKQGESSEKTEDGRRERRRQRRTRREEKKNRLERNADHGETGELMYEMEGGGLKEGSSTGESSETEDSTIKDRQGLLQLADEKIRRRQRWRRLCLIHIFIVIGFLVLVFGSWRLSIGRKKQMTGQKLFNNGTALFAPTTILISLDGFRADFLKRGLTPRLNAFIQEGVSPLYLLPSFPSVTFPNHYTLVTGLYPESHGVVGNTFWDPELQAEFYYTDPERSMQWKWWGGEPLWVTAEKQGIRTAIHMWPGSEAHIMGVEPSFLDPYNGYEPLSRKVDRVLELIDKPGQEDESAATADMRPQLIAAYVPNVDSDGHKYGPNSTEIRITISNVDKMLDQLFTGLEERNLTQVVNVVVVSDHGMATTSTDRLIQLEDIIDLSLIEHIDGWPLYGLRPKNAADLQGLYDKLAAEAATNPNFDVYLRDVNMPERYHFSKNQRIAPLWIIPKTGWAIVTKEEFNVQDAKAKGEIYHPRGLHGYDHEHPLMRAIFVARGPSFPHPPNSRVGEFQNIEVYNIICDSLSLTPNPNNGTLRLPLKPMGLHSPENQASEPSDPVDTPASSSYPSSHASAVAGTDSPVPASTASDAPIGISISPIEASSAADPHVQPPVIVGVDPVDDVDDRPVVGDGKQKSDGDGDGEGGGEKESIFDYFFGKIEDLKEWLGEVLGGEKGVEDGSGGGQR